MTTEDSDRTFTQFTQESAESLEKEKTTTMKNSETEYSIERKIKQQRWRAEQTSHRSGRVSLTAVNAEGQTPLLR